MIHAEWMIKIMFSSSEMKFIKKMAKAAEMNGVSRIRDDAERVAKLPEDSLVGQMCTAALHKYWYGNLTEYVRMRWYQNKAPHQGDGGCDLPGLNVDVKGSLMRRRRNPLDYHLLVRPAERHDGWVYVHSLIEDLSKEEVMLTGWLPEEELPAKVVQEGIFKGAFQVGVPDLYRLPPLVTLWLTP